MTSKGYFSHFKKYDRHRNFQPCLVIAKQPKIFFSRLEKGSFLIVRIHFKKGLPPVDLGKSITFQERNQYHSSTFGKPYHFL